MIKIDRNSPVPLTEQIVEQFSDAIGRGGLAVGVRLPSIRQLATKLGVSPYTVVVAYDQLFAMGLIVSRSSSGFFVASLPAEQGGGSGPGERRPAPEEIDAAWLTRGASEADAGWVAAGSDMLPEHWLEDAVSGRRLQKFMRDQGSLNRPVPVQGSIELRKALSAHLRLAMIFVPPRNILATDGAVEAVDLICRVLLRPDDTVVVEDPANPALLYRLRAQGINLVSIPRRPDGLDVGALEAACRTHRPRLVFTQSAVHNPTGWSSSIGNLHRILMLAEHYGFMIAEDDECGELASGNSARLAQLAGLKNLVYYGSFAKTAGPAVRMGFIAAEERMIEALIDAKIQSASGGSGFSEGIVIEMLRSGRYHKHVKRLRQRLAMARANTADLLADTGLRFDPSGEGIFLWGEVPGHVDLQSLVRDAYGNRILLAIETPFRAARHAGNPAGIAPPSHLRFNVATSNHTRLFDYLHRRLLPPATAAAG